MKSEQVKESVNSSDKDNGSFYEGLPRFIDNQPIEAVGANLPEVERRVAYGDELLTLTISAARVSRPAADTVGGSSQSLSRFPGAIERRLEAALRELAVTGNRNFNAERNILYTGTQQLSEKINRIDAEQQLSEDEIRLALATLFNVSFCLEHKKREFYFRPVEGFERVEKDEESFYKISLSPVFFSDRLFVERLFEDQSN